MRFGFIEGSVEGPLRSEIRVEIRVEMIRLTKIHDREGALTNLT